MVDINLITFLYVALFVLTGLGAVFFLIKVRNQKEIIGRVWHTTLLVASAIWSLAQALEYSVSSLGRRIRVIKPNKIKPLGC